ncbi:transcriptional regulator, GntR family [Microbulbifer donghaiensis]|uniref:Transcriptional regulator, GntR family n=1 Tax=Microbulbifer donghaiensis TaxID=494016 RepID=A0A1M5DWY2_9GAMM|nr:rhamnogalacturonan acetylesterase [Microbulbifer donghaiensis]SHF71507.1 transcriptional regulator, GntR family [Microbulbifer donghaiensis]
MKKLIYALPLLLSAAANAETVFMAGDSTMSMKDVKDYPETGWGVPFQYFFDDSVRVENRAKNGRSTRTFIEEGLWDGIIDDLQPGDVVIIQFGHNDESEKKADRYTTPAEYRANLVRFIRETRARGGLPLLLTSITRRYFNGHGGIRHTHPYAPLAREVARTEKVDFIDMEAITREYFQALGDRDSALRFMHIPPDTHPNYPNGVSDDTHLNQLGAREVAQLLLRELKKMDHPLADRLRHPDPKHLGFSYR